MPDVGDGVICKQACLASQDALICLLPAVRVLREVGQLLVDVNGQHAALSLKDGATRVRCACCGRPSAARQWCSTRLVPATVDEK